MYSGGALMCTSASMHWLIAHLLHGKQGLSNSSYIDRVMNWAQHQYDAIAKSGFRLLSHEDVISHRPLPPCIKTTAYNGHCADLNEKDAEAFGNIVHMHALPHLLEAGSGCLVTACDHTVAVFRDASQSLWFFDSMPAVEKQIDDSSLFDTLREALGRSFQVCDITVLGAAVNTDPHAPKSAKRPARRLHLQEHQA